MGLDDTMAVVLVAGLILASYLIGYWAGRKAVRMHYSAFQGYWSRPSDALIVELEKEELNRQAVQDEIVRRWLLEHPVD